MFFKKCERGHGAAFALTVTALAAVGVMSITKCGNKMIQKASKKVTDFFKKEKQMCEQSLQEE